MNPFCVNKKGYLLPLVIIYMIIAVIVSSGILLLGSLERIDASKRMNREQAFYLAEAGINYARFNLKNNGAWTPNPNPYGLQVSGAAGTDTLLVDNTTSNTTIFVISTGTVRGDAEQIKIAVPNSSSAYPSQVIKTVPTGNNDPTCVWVTPDGNYAYISHWGDGSGTTVDVVRVSDNTIIKTITVGSGPGGIAVTPNGNYAYVADWGIDKVSIIRTSDNTVTGTISVGDGPYNLAVTPNGNYVYVTNYGSGFNSGNTVSVIQTSNNTVTKTITVGTRPISVDFTPDSKYAYVANYGDNTISAIRTSDNTITKTITVGSDPTSVKVSPDGNYAYVTNWGSNNISIIQTSNNTVIGTITVGTLPNDLAFTPSGNYVYITDYGSSSLSVIGKTGGSGSSTAQWTKTGWKQ